MECNLNEKTDNIIRNLKEKPVQQNYKLYIVYHL